jgi:undecaprenyl-diphosphatase
MILPLSTLLAGTAAFIAVAADLHYHGLLAQWDQPIARFLHNHSSPIPVICCSALSFLGEFGVLFPFALLVGLYLLYKRRLFAAIIWAIALLGSVALNESLKRYFKVPRPDHYTYYVWPPGHRIGYSFPSGHTMGVAITAGTLLLLAAHLHLLTKKQSRLAAAAATTLSLAVAFSLLYMGVHTLTDILSALALATAWLSIISLLLQLRKKTSILPAPLPH